MRQIAEVRQPGSPRADALKLGSAMLTFRAFAFEIMVSIHKVRDAIAGAIVAYIEGVSRKKSFLDALALEGSGPVVGCVSRLFDLDSHSRRELGGLV